MATQEEVYEALRTCYDPEIPVNIVDLGLVYNVEVVDQKVDIKMTLTARGCGMGGYIAAEAEQKVLELPDVEEAKVELVWEPPWEPGMMSPEARKMLGMPEDE
ncbi:MAG: metal-sulfur cluster assembly factor [Candidatus Binatia bacterium]